MKFFEAVPDELFSPLASPNRALYADALDVLCMAYRQKLRLPEDELYSMLRSRLEQQLADATFGGRGHRRKRAARYFRPRALSHPQAVCEGLVREGARPGFPGVHHRAGLREPSA